MKRDLLTRQIYEAMENVIIKGTDLLPFVRPDQDEVVRKVNSLSNETFAFQRPGDFFRPELLLDVLDTAAYDYIRNAQIVVTSSGGLTGTLGLPGIALDMPVLVAATVGMVRRHALVYGFTDIEEAGGDKMPLLVAFGSALGAEAAINSMTKRFVGVATGDAVERMLARLISQQMAGRIVTKILPRAVPIISSATSAMLDYWFVRAAGRRSMSYFRARHQLGRKQAGRILDITP